MPSFPRWLPTWARSVWVVAWARFGLSKLVPKTLDATFTFAFQPNCPLEANPAIASVSDGKAEVWAPMKTPITAQQDIAEALGIPQDAVTCHVIQGGGSFGRDLFWDGAREAALISQAMGKPVKLLWHRTDDFRQGRAHPPADPRSAPPTPATPSSRSRSTTPASTPTSVTASVRSSPASSTSSPAVWGAWASRSPSSP